MFNSSDFVAFESGWNIHIFQESVGLGLVGVACLVQTELRLDDAPTRIPENKQQACTLSTGIHSQLRLGLTLATRVVVAVFPGHGCTLSDGSAVDPNEMDHIS